MRSRYILICAVVMLFLSVSFAFSQERNVTGEVSVTGVLPYVSGNEAKFNEYRDYKDSTVRPFAGGYLQYDNKKGYYLDFSASDIGYDTQRYSLEGGKYGSYKYSLLYDEIVHNQTWDARTFYGAPGSNTLDYVAASGNRPTNDTNNWVEFDYKTKRKRMDAGAELSLMKPFYFTVDAGREKKEGTGWAGISQNTSTGAEIPSPVDFTTDHMTAEIGYGKKPFFAAFNYYYQKFSNDDPYLNVRSPFPSVANNDKTPLAPKNDYQKFSFAGNTQLPWNSKFNLKAAYAMANSDKNLTTSYWTSGSSPTSVTYNDSKFDGSYNTQNYAGVLTSTPFSFLTGKAYYKYYKKDNTSDHIHWVQGGTEFTNPLFGYLKENYGAELDFGIMKNLHLIAAYGHNYIDRRREDIPKDKDDVYSMEARYKLPSLATLKVGYEYMVRAADHEWVAGDPVEEQYIRRYDAAARNQYGWKVDLQLYPLDYLNFNFMYKYTKVDYKDTTLGIQNTVRNFWGVNGDLTYFKWMKVYGYFDWDKLTTDQFQRRVQNQNAANPWGPIQNSTDYNWTADQSEKNYDWGLGFDFYPIPKKLTVRLGYDYVRSSGTVDYNYLTAAAIPSGQSNDSVDLNNVDNYRKEAFSIKAFYNATPALTLMGGWSYESYKYSDAGYNGYRYTLPVGSATPSVYYTGLYADPSYKANVYYLGANYKF